MAVAERSLAWRKVNHYGELEHLNRYLGPAFLTNVNQAMFIMSANLAGVVGGFLFRSDDKPYYYRGWSIITAFVSLALALVLYLNIQYALINRRMERQKLEEIQEYDIEMTEDAEGTGLRAKTRSFNS